MHFSLFRVKISIHSLISILLRGEGPKEFTQRCTNNQRWYPYSFFKTKIFARLFAKPQEYQFLLPFFTIIFAYMRSRTDRGMDVSGLPGGYGNFEHRDFLELSSIFEDVIMNLIINYESLRVITGHYEAQNII